MHRLVAAAFAACLAASLAACGSSTQTVTGPTTNKCAVTATADKSSFGADGGSGNITVSTNRECQWSAQSSSPWLTLGSGSSGQGDGKVPFTVTANADPSARRATVNVNDQQVSISEEAAPCQFTVSPVADTVSPAGERRTIAVGASSPQCAWTATSNVGWLAITSGAPGTGNGTVTYDAQPTSGPTRSGTLTVAGHTVNVTQGTGCSVVISPTGQAVGAAGGSGSITVNTGAGCTWTVDTNVPWITLTSGSTGAGPGTVTFTVAAWNGPARTGTITVSGQVFTITQGEGCSFSLSTSSASIAAGGGSGSVQVITADGCSWNASSNAGWVSIASGNSGSGRGTVQFTAVPNTGAARDATLTIANQPFVVRQAAAACTYSINPQSVSFPDALPHSSSFALTTRSDCSWTASPSDSTWIHVLNSSGSGSATINFNVDENKTPGSSRSGSISVGGQTFAISQAAPPCTYSLNPTSQNFDASGGSGSFAVTTAAACSWTATASAAWIQITSTTASTVNFTVNPNGDTQPRTGTITVQGQTFTITQAAAACTYSLNPTSQNFDASGGSGSFGVTTAAGCSWTATASDSTWIHVSNSSGSGSATINFNVDENKTPGASRTGSISVGGQTFSISQAAPACTYSLNPTSQNFDASGGSGSFAVTTPAGCSWTATASVGWIQVTSTTAAAVNFTVNPNSDTQPRTGTITVQGQTFTITQAAAPCTYSLNPTSQNFDASGGSGSFTVTTTAGCSWTAAASVGWIQVASTTATTVNFTVNPNTDTQPRTGTIAVQGQTFTVNQTAPAPAGLRN